MILGWEFNSRSHLFWSKELLYNIWVKMEKARTIAPALCNASRYESLSCCSYASAATVAILCSFRVVRYGISRQLIYLFFPSVSPLLCACLFSVLLICLYLFSLCRPSNLLFLSKNFLSYNYPYIVHHMAPKPHMFVVWALPTKFFPVYDSPKDD